MANHQFNIAYNTLNDCYVGARFRTGVNTTDFAAADANLLTLANKYYRKVVLAMMQDNEDYFATITAINTANGGNPYALSSDSSLGGGGANLQVLRVEVTYDNTLWKVATPLQYGEISTPTKLTADVTAQFNTNEPYYALFGNSIYFFPDFTSVITGGIRVFEVTRQKELAASTDSFGETTSATQVILPKEFMEIIEDGIVGDLYERLGKFQESMLTKQMTEAKLEKIRMQFGRRNEDFDLSVKVDPNEYKE